jgi:hypothetical protein
MLCAHLLTDTSHFLPSLVVVWCCIAVVLWPCSTCVVPIDNQFSVCYSSWL